jgi:spore maturation protein CgeB
MAYARAAADGYKLGWQDGHWYGRCEGVRQHSIVQIPMRALHVLYVATGESNPYQALDEAIIDSLSRLVSKLSIVLAGAEAVEAAQRIKPDIVLVLDGRRLGTESAARLRASGIRTAVWFTDDPYYSDITVPLAQNYDHVFTLERNMVDVYRLNGCPSVHYLPFAAFVERFLPGNPGRRDRFDIGFVGSAYMNRVALFDEIADYLAKRSFRIAGRWWERLSNYEKLAHRIQMDQWMNQQDTAAFYNQARIIINMHRDHNDNMINMNSLGIPAASPNPRTFEINACAVLQMSDIRDDMASFFLPGEEIVLYESPEDLLNKFEYYLTHEEERQAIALRGMRRVMRDHTYDRRLDQMLVLLGF